MRYLYLFLWMLSGKNANRPILVTTLLH